MMEKSTQGYRFLGYFIVVDNEHGALWQPDPQGVHKLNRSDTGGVSPFSGGIKDPAQVDDWNKVTHLDFSPPTEMVKFHSVGRT